MTRPGAVAEWLGRGLQSLVQQFESARRLRLSHLPQLTHFVPRLRVVASVTEPCESLTRLTKMGSGLWRATTGKGICDAAPIDKCYRPKPTSLAPEGCVGGTRCRHRPRRCSHIRRPPDSQRYRDPRRNRWIGGYRDRQDDRTARLFAERHRCGRRTRAGHGRYQVVTSSATGHTLSRLRGHVLGHLGAPVQWHA